MLLQRHRPHISIRCVNTKTNKVCWLLFCTFRVQGRMNWHLVLFHCIHNRFMSITWSSKESTRISKKSSDGLHYMVWFNEWKQVINKAWIKCNVKYNIIFTVH
jgi:hypothetical protein